jgi:hypothetical protein
LPIELEWLKTCQIERRDLSLCFFNQNLLLNILKDAETKYDLLR